MHPQLYLGLIGFDEQERAAIAAFITANALEAEPTAQGDTRLHHPIWHIVDYLQADALFINGGAVKQSLNNHLYFQPRAPSDQHSLATSSQPSHEAMGESPLAIYLDDLKQPCALSQRQKMLEDGVLLAASYPNLNTQDARSMLAALQRFEVLLRPLRSMYTLATQLIERREELDDQHTCHLEDNGTLHAILDVPQRRILMRPTVRPVDIEGDNWCMRPKSATYAPADFIECSFDEVAWVFAMHSPELKLPSRYSNKPIYLRRMPRVRPSMLYARHSVLMEHLHLQPITHAQLCDTPGIDETWLERDLFALYLCRSITTTPIKGVPSSLQSDTKPDSGLWSSRHDAVTGLPEASALDRLSRSMSTMTMPLLERI
jgi:hypothetical protein